MIPSDTQSQVILRYPEVRKNHIFLRIIPWREHKHECRDIRGTGKVESAIAFPSEKLLIVHGKGTGIPLIHLHPPGALFYPLVQTELPEHVLLCCIFFCTDICILHFLNINCISEGGICFIPYFLTRPVILIGCTVNNRVEGRVDFSSLNDIQCLLVLFKTHGIPVRSCRCDQEEQGLCSCITGTLGHDIEQFPIRLCMQLIKDNRMDIQAVLGICLSRQHLIEAVGRFIYKPFHGHDRLDPFLQCRTLVYHIHRNIKYDGSLLPVGSTAVNLCSPLTVTACHIKCDGCCQF